jgi:hypothetical protein
MASPPEPSPPPERPVQLRNDLNDLYGLFGDLQTTVRGIAATQQDHGVRLVRVERGVTELRSDVTEVRHDVTELRSDVTEVRTDVTELRGGMAGVRGELGGLRTDVDGLRAGQDEILRLLRDRG